VEKVDVKASTVPDIFKRILKMTDIIKKVILIVIASFFQESPPKEIGAFCLSPLLYKKNATETVAERETKTVLIHF
jgi:hypothetical protein